MPSYYHDRYRKDGYELAHHIGRDLRHSHRPTRYIINEGKLVIDERTLDYRDGSNSSRSNTIIYNAPGSTMWVEKQHRDEKSHQKSGCRACFRTHDRRYGGYCSDCLTLRLDTPRRREVITVHDRRSVEYPERKALQWR
jgi:hypothetical protein